MSKFTEETFNNWRYPASETEEQRISNAISMIRDAINKSDSLKYKDIEVFVQGSYGNTTNVRVDSDVDICVMLKNTFYSEYPEGISSDDFGFYDATYDFTTFRADILKALNAKFGTNNIKSGNKSIEIIENSYRVKADVIPAFQYRNYKHINSSNPEKFIEGIKFYAAKTNEEVINYPKMHLNNGSDKNVATKRRYKRLVRIFKRIKYKMIDDGVRVENGISSFLIESLLWNTPDSIFNDNDTWTEKIKYIIIYLYLGTIEENDYKQWLEVSTMLNLFHNGRKWNVKMTHDYLYEMWNYLEFKI